LCMKEGSAAKLIKIFGRREKEKKSEGECGWGGGGEYCS